MALPYVSARRGRFQWMMQRVSAILLLFLAFFHFGLQHFSSEAVSTGLTVTFRMNNPLWQSYYAIFVLLVLYHGVNGLVGIVSDYAPRALYRNIIAIILWTVGSAFAVMGLSNIISPRTVDDVKIFYATEGFGKGQPSIPALPIEFDLQQPDSELAMLEFYLAHHTARNEEAPAERAAIFGAEGTRDGDLFNAWAKAQVKAGPIKRSERERATIFSSTYEFAVWALNVRKANAENRGDDAQVKALASTVAYSADMN